MPPRGTTTKIVVLFLAGMFGAALLTSDRPRHNQARSASSGRGKDGSQKHSVVFQDRTNNCGAAALKMILEHFGHPVSLRDLEQELALPSGRTSLQRLKEVGDKHGLRAKGWRLRQEDLAYIRFPIIVFLRKNHFVVADSMNASGSLSLRDPATGTIEILRDVLPCIWDGEALTFFHNPTSNTRTKKTGLKE